MKIFGWLKGLFNKGKNNGEDGALQDDLPEYAVNDRSEIDMSDSEVRGRYVRNCCDQMMEATREIDSATMEYRLVTDYLNDMEEIDALPDDKYAALKKTAEDVMKLENDREFHTSRVGKISSEKYDEMEGIAPEMPAAADLIKEHEDYKYLVKSDLQKLEGEKASYVFTKREMHIRQVSCRNMAFITVFAVSFTFLMLLILQYVLNMNSMIGYIITAALAAVSLTGIFISYSDASREYRAAAGFLNQIIAKQNTVKIRYVNTENLLEYEYSKYHVHTSDELYYYWKLYLEEKKERELLDEAGTALSAVQERYLRELREIHLKYPAIWLHQAFALADKREMVEIRHDLFGRRQSLRKRIDYNTENRNAAKNEVNDLVRKYPNYGKEILDIVSAYE